MRSSPCISVTGPDGFHGTLDPDARSSDQGPARVLLRLDDGRELWVPEDRLVLQDDNSYFLPRIPVEVMRDAPPSATGTDLTVIPLVEETIAVGKRKVETGTVRVRKVVREHEAMIDEALTREDVQIERIPVHRPVEGPIPVRREGDKTIVSLVEEVLVVEKRLMLTEEIHISVRQVETHEPQRVTLRREEAEIERIPAASSPDAEPV